MRDFPAPLNDPTAQDKVNPLDALSEKIEALRNKHISPEYKARLRQDLSSIAGQFKGAAKPAIEKLAKALPTLSDSGACWVSAKMLRDLAVTSGEGVDEARHALTLFMHTAKDSDTRKMAAALLADIGVSHGGDVAGHVVQSIARTLLEEKDPRARHALRADLLRIGLRTEPCAYLVVEALGQAISVEQNPFDKIRIAHELGQLGSAHHSLPLQITRVLGEETKRSDQAASATAMVLRSIGLAEKKSTPTAVIHTLASAMAYAKDQGAVANYSSALSDVGAQHPREAFETFCKLTQLPREGQRLCAYMGLRNISALEGYADKAASHLGSLLAGESSAYNRRLLGKCLFDCAQNGADPKMIGAFLRNALVVEKDLDVTKELNQTLYRLGDFGKRGSVVVPLVRTEQKM